MSLDPGKEKKEYLQNTKVTSKITGKGVLETMDAFSHTLF